MLMHAAVGPVCPECGFRIFNRRFPKCESCGVLLPAALVCSAAELAARRETERIEEMVRKTEARGGQDAAGADSSFVPGTFSADTSGSGDGGAGGDCS